MTWIKKVMNRFFDTEKDEEIENEIEIENDMENSKPENDMEEARREKPAFRFPIITDAEIYGWEPDADRDPESDRKKLEQLVTELDDDDFEPIPLYKNDRWPSDNTKVTIHKSTSTPKYRTGITDNPLTTPMPEKSVSKEEDDKRSTIIQKRSNRPFTPTNVPSPVYGYRKPKPKMEDYQSIYDNEIGKVEESQTENATEFQYENEETEIAGSIINNEIYRIESEDPVHTLDKDAEMIERESNLTPPLEKEQPDERESVEVMKPLDDLPEIDDRTEVIIEESVDVSPVIETEEQKVEQPVEIMEEETIEHEEAEPPKKEKIVPFNVLMLKNDKLKYETHDKKEISSQTSMIEEREETGRAISQNEDTVKNVSEREDVFEEIEEPPHYALPPKNFLIHPEEHIEDTEWLQSQSVKLEEALSYFAVQANVIEAVQGPTVTRFELTVGHGTKVSKVRNLTDDLKLALAAEDIRIQAPIPGTSSIGIEIPNRKARPVRISEVIETKRFQESESPLEAVLGLSLTGEPVTLDLRKMPHGMIAGATGSGKSVCINSILISLLYKAAPTDLKMLLIDPKMVELAPFNGIPHLLSPVITDVKAATAALKWAVGEMERRYELFAHVGARNIERYNEMAEKDRKFSLKLPYLLIVIDELADLMMMAPADVEVSISRITQKARACGIHLIIATQRPSVDVITGTIKANVPTRIAFSVSSQIDSRTIIDTPGAERLLGKGDMLYLGNGQSSAVRLQGTFVTDAEIERIIEHVQNEADPDYLFGQDDLLANSIEEEESDPLFTDACLFIIDQGSASTSLLQRNFSIGYNRAAKLMDRMEKLGFISEQKGSKPRDVFLTETEFSQFLNGTDKPVER